MLQINQLRLSLDHDDASLKTAIARELRVPLDHILSVIVEQRAIDARRGNVEFSFTVKVEVRDEPGVLHRHQGNQRIIPAPDHTYIELAAVKPASKPTSERPIIIGTGPCGLICGLMLARHGRRPILLERGKAAGDRARDVTGFWRRGLEFNGESNVMFGEGGAGTFSDGKLYTQIRDRENRIPWLLNELVKAGAPEDILIKSRPHIGTDRLIKVVRTIREEIIALGGEVRFDSRVDNVVIEGGQMKAIVLSNGEEIAGSAFIFAVGHSARETFAMLHKNGVEMERKALSVGVRIEHPQTVVDRSQYGRFAGHPKLGAAPYKFVAHCDSGRSAYSFCMCPGGLVVAASSEAGGVVTNGMSSYARAESNANSGFMVEINEADYDGDGPLAGIEFQRKIEQRAFVAAGSDYKAPAQKLGDFMRGVASTGPGSVKATYEPGVQWTDLRPLLPDYVTATLTEAVRRVERVIPGFAMDDAVMTGVETRSSSPLRIPRDPVTCESLSVRSFYPAGEGAGYAGGIISAAVDGMKVAEQLLKHG